MKNIKDFASNGLGLLVNDAQKDKNNYLRMYGLAWVAFIGIMLFCSYLAGRADFFVLFALFKNSSTPSPFFYSISVAVLIQAIILFAGALVGKIWAFGLWKQRKHIFQMMFFLPSLLVALGASLWLSFQTEEVAIFRNEEKLERLSDNKEKMDKEVFSPSPSLSQNFRKDSLGLENTYKEKISGIYSQYSAQLSSLKAEAKRYRGIKAGWAKNTAKDIEGRKIPQIRAKRAEAIGKLKEEKGEKLLELLSDNKKKEKRMEAQYKEKMAGKKALWEEESSRISTNISRMAKTLKGQNIAFSLFGCFLSLGLAWFIKFAMEEPSSKKDSSSEDQSSEDVEAVLEDWKLEELLEKLDSYIKTPEQVGEIGSQRINPKAVEEIVKIQNRLKKYLERSKTSKTEEARKRNERKLEEEVLTLRNKFGILAKLKGENSFSYE